MEIKEEVNRQELEKWKKRKAANSLLETFHNEEIKDPGFYDNTWGSELLFKARTNTLKLGWRLNKMEGVSAMCRVCDDKSIEDVVHFVGECKGYETIRRKKNYIGETNCMNEILLFTSNLNIIPQAVMKMLEEMWKFRRRAMEDQ